MNALISGHVDSSSSSSNSSKIDNNGNFNENLTSKITKKTSNYAYDAIIIGGGVAGIEAARKLYQNGLTNILLLEAQDYLGGRMKTIYYNNDKTVPLEMGKYYS
jgi:heterodisulfide reductase subunit A-like polyferredoxin